MSSAGEADVPEAIQDTHCDTVVGCTRQVRVSVLYGLLHS